MAINTTPNPVSVVLELRDLVGLYAYYSWRVKRNGEKQQQYSTNPRMRAMFEADERTAREDRDRIDTLLSVKEFEVSERLTKSS